MGKEFQKGLDTGTYKQVDPPSPSTPLLLLKQIFKNKLNSLANLERLKARLCARGDLQSTVLDIYAATLATKAFRFIMALVAYFDLECEQFDFVAAYLNSLLLEPIYLEPPQGISNSNKVLLLFRALYSLKELGQIQ